MIAAAEAGVLTLDKLEAMTADLLGRIGHDCRSR